MKLEKINLTPQLICDYINSRLITLDNPIQRGSVWNRGIASKFIHSLVVGYPIGVMYANKVDKVFDIIDGKQRSESIFGFINNNFKLSNVSDVIIDNGEVKDLMIMEYDHFSPEIQSIIESVTKIDDEFKKIWFEIYPQPIKEKIISNSNVISIAGKYFDELPSEIQEAILFYNIDFQFGKDMTEREMAAIFDRLNNGKPLTGAEKSKSKIMSPIPINNLEKHKLFTTLLNQKSVKKKAMTAYVMQSYVVLFSENKCLLSKDVGELLRRAEISQEKEQRINSCFDVYYKILGLLTDSPIDKKIKRILRAKSHFSSFLLIADYVVSNEIDVNTMIDWLRHFLDVKEIGSTTISDEYNRKIKDNTNSTESVTTRIEAALSDFMEFIGR